VDLVAAREVEFGQMGADEAGSSRDKNVHVVSPLLNKDALSLRDLVLLCIT
jgi:hypothetical protein